MSLETKDVLWQDCLRKIEEQILPDNYANWFTSTYPHTFGNGFITIAVPNYFYKKCLSENYLGLIENTLESLSNSKIQVEFLVDPNFAGEKVEEKSHNGSQPAETQKVTVNPKRSSMNPKYIFPTFIVGSSNQFAHAAATAVAKHPAMAYNPLFIYGGVGLGKTHLLHAIGNAIVENDPTARVRYTSAESFTVDLIESLKKDDMASFRRRHRPLDVLLVDDIQFLAGKERTQEEFFYTFNALYESHKQVVISSDKYPKELHNIEERLRSRFQSGLIADIKIPDLETKIAILYKKAEFHNKEIPDEVAYYIASNIKSNVRELEGLLLRIIAFASFSHKPIDLDLAKEVLREFTFDKTKNFTVPTILKTVASHFNVRVNDLKSKKRSRDISVPRQIAMYICREYTKLSLPDIGRQFGGKDHTTVIHSHKKISKLVNDNNEISKSIEQIIGSIEDR